MAETAAAKSILVPACRRRWCLAPTRPLLRMPSRRLLSVFTVALIRAQVTLASHPCQAEVDSACPDRPGPEIGRCLKDKSEHETPTDLSSECTDFVALNKACAEDLEKHCDNAFFSGDTVLCLTQWTDKASLSAKCAGVMEWAIPKKEAEDSDGGPTDELGMSEKDYAEKQAWRARRKSERSAAIERMRETDASKEKERQKMERIKKENPEEYAWLMKEKEEAQKRLQEARKHERLMAAAKERKRRKDAGLPEDETANSETESDGKKRRATRTMPPPKRTWLPYILGGLFIAFVFFNILNFFQKKKDDEDKDE